MPMQTDADFPVNAVSDSWAVVATVCEPLPVVLAFVAHHLSLGAVEVHIYLDDPDDPAFEVLQACVGCIVTRCDAAHMRSIGFQQRPENQNQRQKRNANHAMKCSQAQWIAHLDADELMVFPGDVGRHLAEVSQEHVWVQLPHVERVWTPADRSDTLFDGPFHFRMPDRRGLTEGLYGEAGFLLHMGHVGTVAGKSFVRCDRDCILGIHRPRQGKYEHRKVPPRTQLKGAAVLHFHGATARAWVAKVARYAALTGETQRTILSVARLRLIERFLTVQGDRAREVALHQELFHMTEEQLDVLDLHGLLQTHRLNTEAAVRAFFPDNQGSLTPTDLDDLFYPGDDIAGQS